MSLEDITKLVTASKYARVPVPNKGIEAIVNTINNPYITTQDRQNLTGLNIEQQQTYQPDPNILNLYENLNRTNPQVVQDTLTNIGTGAISGIGGIAQGLSSLVEANDVSRSIKDTTESTTGYLRDNLTSDTGKSIDSLFNQVNEVRSVNDKKELDSSTSWLDTLGTIGKQAMRAGSDSLTENPVKDLGDLVGSIGSSVVLGGVGSALGKAGGAITALTAASVADGVNQTTDVIDNMSDVDLANTLLGKTYLENGNDPQGLRDYVRTVSAQETGIKALPLAALTSVYGDKLAKGIIKGKLNKFGIANAVTDSVSEAGDEANTLLASNSTLQNNIDPNVSLTDNLGATIGQTIAGTGAISGSVGTLNTPGLLLDKVKESVKNSSPVGEKALKESSNNINTIVDSLNENVKQYEQIDPETNTVSVSPDAPVEKIQSRDISNKLIDAYKPELTDELVNENVKDKLITYTDTDGKTKVDTVKSINNVIKRIGESKTKEEALDSALYIMDNLNKINSLNEEYLNNNTDTEIDPLLGSLNEEVKRLNSSESIQKVQEFIKSEIIQEVPKDRSLNQEDIQKAIKIGSINIDAIDSRIVDAVEQYTNNSSNADSEIQFTDFDKEFLKSGSFKVLMKAIEPFIAFKKEMEALDKIPSNVTKKAQDLSKDNEVLSNNFVDANPAELVQGTIDTQNNILNESVNFKTSLKEHNQRILAALPTGSSIDSKGNKYDLETAVNNLKLFGEHLLRKSEAINQSIDSDGKSIKFDKLDPRTKQIIPANNVRGGKFAIKANTQASKNVAAAIYSETLSAVNTYNNIIKSNPDKFTDAELLPKPVIHEKVQDTFIKYRSKEELSKPKEIIKDNKTVIEKPKEKIKKTNTVNSKENTTKVDEPIKEVINTELVNTNKDATQTKKSNYNLLVDAQKDKNIKENLYSESTDVKSYFNSVSKEDYNNLSEEQKKSFDYLSSVDIIKNIKIVDISTDSNSKVRDTDLNPTESNLVSQLSVELEGTTTKTLALYNTDTNTVYYSSKDKKLDLTSLMHEVWHALTVPIIVDLFKNKGKNLTNEQIKALQNINDLGLELKNNVLTDKDKENKRLIQFINKVLFTQRTDKDKLDFVSLAEIITYGLTELDVIEKLKDTKISSKLFDKIKEFYKQIFNFLGLPFNLNSDNKGKVIFSNNFYSNLFTNSKLLVDLLENTFDISNDAQVTKIDENITNDKLSNNVDSSFNTEESIKDIIKEEPKETINDNIKTVQEPNKIKVESEEILSNKESVSKETYSNLVTSNKTGKNIFLSGFNLKKNFPTINEIFNMLNNIVELNTNALIDYVVEPEKVTRLLKVAGSVHNDFIAHVNKVINSDKIQKLLASTIESKDDILLLPSKKLLGLLDKDTFELNDDLTKKSSLAFTHWLLNTSKNNNLETEDDLLNFDADNIKALYTQSKAKEDLARVIMRFWGVTPNKTETQSNNRFLAEALAAEYIEAFKDTKDGLLFKVDKVKTDKGNLLNVVTFNEDNLGKIKKELGKHINIFAEVIGDTEDKTYSIGSPIKNTSDSYINSSTKLNKNNKKLIQAANSIKHTFNKGWFDFTQSLGKLNYNSLIGFISTEDQIFHEEQLKTINGKNLSLVQNWDNTFEKQQELLKYAEANNIPIEEAEVYYNHKMSKVLRLQQSNGGQSNKYEREILVPNKSVIDLTDVESIKDFWITIAQGTGLVKIENNSREDNVRLIKEKLLKTYGKQISYIRDNYGTDKFDPEEYTNMFKGEVLTDVQLHSIYTVAMLSKAVLNGDNTFDSYLSVEADGKTNGLMNYIINFSIGEFTIDFITNVAKGGFLIGSKNNTIADNLKDDPDDLYETLSQEFNIALTKRSKFFYAISKKSNVPTAVDYTNNLYNFITMFSDLTKQNQEYKSNRALIKEPLNPFIYGAGKNSIALDTTNNLLTRFYEEVTKFTQNKESVFTSETQIINMIEGLFSHEFVYSESGYVESISDRTNIDIKNVLENNKQKLQNFKLNKKYKEELVNIIKELYVTPLLSTFKNKFKGNLEVISDIQKITEMQSIVSIDVFNQRLDALLQERRNNGNIGKQEFLSIEDYTSVFNDIYGLMPNYVTDQGEINISGSEYVKSDYIGLSASLEDKGRAESSLKAPTLAGVKSQPFITIGMGDASMIQIYMNETTGTHNVGLVFDGVNMSATEFRDNSKELNKAVLETYNINKFTGLLNSLNTFKNILENTLKDSTVDLNTKTYKEVFDLFYSDSVLTKEILFDLIQEKINLLEKYKLSTDARNKALKQVGLSIDHMSGASNPYIQEGDIFDSKEDLVNKLNEYYNKELIDLESKNKIIDPITKQEKPNKELFAKAKSLSIDKDFIVLGKAQIIQLLNTGNLSKEQSYLLKQMIKSIPEYYTFIFNDPELNNIEAARAKYYPNSNIDLSHNGVTVPGINAVFINNIANETMLHEILHTVTVNIIRLYYANPENLTPAKRNNIRILEELMNQFLQTDFKDTTLAVLNLKEVIRSALSEDSTEDNFNKVKALNEFIAWTLTNQDLIQKTQNTKVVYNKTFKDLFKKVIKSIKALFGLKKETQLQTIYDNVLFNTLAVVEANELSSLRAVLGNVQLNQETVLPKVKKLKNHVQKFLNASYKADPNKTKDIVASKVLNKAIKNSVKITEALNTVITNGFDFTDEQKQTYKQIFNMFNGEFELNTKAYINLQKVYTKAIKDLSPSDFLSKEFSLDPRDTEIANNKYAIITGYNLNNDNSILANFLALSQIDPAFNKLLSNLSFDKEIVKYSSLDQYLEDVSDKALNSLTSKDFNSKNFSDTLNLIKDNILETNVETNNSKAISDIKNTLNKYDPDKLVTDTVQKFAEKLSLSNNNTVSLLGDILDVKKTDVLKETLISMVNQFESLPTLIKELVKELQGKTYKTLDIENLLPKVKYAVSKTRQDFRTTLPSIFESKFKTKPTKQQWVMLNTVLAKTDIFSFGSVKEILSLLQSGNINNRITVLENELKSIDPIRHKEYLSKSKQLANYMNTNYAGKNLLRNAYSIAKLANEDNFNTSEPTNKLISTIDELVSLYAYNSLDKDTKQEFNNLLKEEYDGVSFISNYLQAIVKNENKKINKQDNKYNYYKGYTPLNSSEGAKLIVSNDQNYETLIENGFTRISDYTGSSANSETQKYGYYYSNVIGSPYEQGIMQTAQESVNGINSYTGRSVNGKTAGYLEYGDIAYINKRIKQSKKETSEEFLPVFDSNGNVVGFERSIDPEMLKKLKHNEELHTVIGVWRGRQAEELFGKEFNKLLVDRSYDLYKQDYNSEKNSFVNIAQSKDPIHRESWKLIPDEIKEYIYSKYGKGNFFVRKDLINNTIGYRLPSVTDVFTNKTRLNKSTTNAIKDISKIILGTKAYKYLTTAERGIQAFVGYARNWIVVKSVVVPAGNITSNIVQLMSSGVPIKDITKNSKKAFIELNQFIKNEQRRIEIETELYSAANIKDKKTLEFELRTINNVNNNLSIKPLIDAGEYNTISEGLTDIDVSLSDNKIGEWIENQVNKLPEALQTVGRYSIIGKDTALYKGLMRSLQYGDFIAKYVSYINQIENGINEQDALNRVSEQFVNYNSLAGRSRSYLESIGLTMFWTFKIRILKEALSMVRNNPVKALLMNFTVNELPDIGIGSPLEDNILSQTVSGKIGYSTGWGMALNAHNLNPWNSIIS